MKKAPWGILMGVSMMLVFYLTVAVIAAYMILNQIAMQTNTTTTIFGTWWQTLIFVIDIFACLACFGFLFLYIRQKMLNKTNNGVSVEETLVAPTEQEKKPIATVEEKEEPVKKVEEQQEVKEEPVKAPTKKTSAAGTKKTTAGTSAPKKSATATSTKKTTSSANPQNRRTTK